MILLLDTSTPNCKLTLVDGDWRQDYEWQADRTLANNLLKYLENKLNENNKTWDDISGLGVFQGPGSFTGLRIGLTVFNTLAEANSVPIVSAQGDEWRDEAVAKLLAGENEKIVLPHYGSDPHITTPRK